MAAKEYEVLYTHQKTKKAKVWQDGVLRVLKEGTKCVLFDDKNCRLDTVFVKPCDVRPGEQLESDRYLILVEQEKPASQLLHQPTESNAPSVQQSQYKSVQRAQYKSVQRAQYKSVQLNVSTAQQSLSPPVSGCHQDVVHRPPSGKCVVAGLKRKRSGFIPPRVVKPSVVDTTSSKNTTFQPQRPNISQQPQQFGCENIMNMYSKPHDSTEHGQSSEKFDISGISPHLTGFMAQLRKEHVARTSPTQSPQHTPWRVFGSPSAISPSYSPLSTHLQPSSQENVQQDEAYGSCSGVGYSVKTCVKKSVKQYEPGSSRSPTYRELVEGSGGVSMGSERGENKHILDVESNDRPAVCETKRTASQIMALLKSQDNDDSKSVVSGISCSVGFAQHTDVLVSSLGMSDHCLSKQQLSKGLVRPSNVNNDSVSNVSNGSVSNVSNGSVPGKLSITQVQTGNSICSPSKQELSVEDGFSCNVNESPSELISAKTDDVYHSSKKQEPSVMDGSLCSINNNPGSHSLSTKQAHGMSGQQTPNTFNKYQDLNLSQGNKSPVSLGSKGEINPANYIKSSININSCSSYQKENGCEYKADIVRSEQTHTEMDSNCLESEMFDEQMSLSPQSTPDCESKQLSEGRSKSQLLQTAVQQENAKENIHRLEERNEQTAEAEKSSSCFRSKVNTKTSDYDCVTLEYLKNTEFENNLEGDASFPVFPKLNKIPHGNLEPNEISKESSTCSQNEIQPRQYVKQNEISQENSRIAQENSEVPQDSGKTTVRDPTSDVFFEITFSPLSDVSPSDEDECVQEKTNHCSQTSLFSDDPFLDSAPLEILNCLPSVPEPLFHTAVSDSVETVDKSVSKSSLNVSECSSVSEDTKQNSTNKSSPDSCKYPAVVADGNDQVLNGLSQDNKNKQKCIFNKDSSNDKKKSVCNNNEQIDSLNLQKASVCTSQECDTTASEDEENGVSHKGQYKSEILWKENGPLFEDDKNAMHENKQNTEIASKQECDAQTVVVKTYFLSQKDENISKEQNTDVSVKYVVSQEDKTVRTSLKEMCNSESVMVETAYLLQVDKDIMSKEQISTERLSEEYIAKTVPVKNNTFSQQGKNYMHEGDGQSLCQVGCNLEIEHDLIDQSTNPATPEDVNLTSSVERSEGSVTFTHNSPVQTLGDLEFSPDSDVSLSRSSLSEERLPESWLPCSSQCPDSEQSYWNMDKGERNCNMLYRKLNVLSPYKTQSSDASTTSTTENRTEKCEISNSENHSDANHRNRICHRKRRNCDAESLFIDRPVLQQHIETSLKNHDAESLFMTTFKSSNFSVSQTGEDMCISPAQDVNTSLLSNHTEGASVSCSPHLKTKSGAFLQSDSPLFSSDKPLISDHREDDERFRNQSRMLASQSDGRMADESECPLDELDDKHAVMFPSLLASVPHPSDLFMENKKKPQNNVDGASSKLAKYKMKGSKSGHAARPPHNATFVQVRRETNGKNNPWSSTLDLSKVLDPNHYKISPDIPLNSPINDFNSPIIASIGTQCLESVPLSLDVTEILRESSDCLSKDYLSSLADEHEVDGVAALSATNHQQVNVMSRPRHLTVGDLGRAFIANSQSAGSSTSDTSWVPDTGAHFNTENWTCGTGLDNPALDIMHTEESFYVDWNEGKPKFVEDLSSTEHTPNVHHVPHIDRITSIIRDPSPSVCQQVPGSDYSDSPGLVLSTAEGTYTQGILIRSQHPKKPLKTQPFDDVVSHSTCTTYNSASFPGESKPVPGESKPVPGESKPVPGEQGACVLINSVHQRQANSSEDERMSDNELVEFEKQISIVSSVKSEKKEIPTQEFKEHSNEIPPLDLNHFRQSNTLLNESSDNLCSQDFDVPGYDDICNKRSPINTIKKYQNCYNDFPVSRHNLESPDLDNMEDQKETKSRWEQYLQHDEGILELESQMQTQSDKVLKQNFKEYHISSSFNNSQYSNDLNNSKTSFPKSGPSDHYFTDNILTLGDNSNAEGDNSRLKSPVMDWNDSHPSMKCQNFKGDRSDNLLQNNRRIVEKSIEAQVSSTTSTKTRKEHCAPLITQSTLEQSNAFQTVNSVRSVSEHMSTDEDRDYGGSPVLFDESQSYNKRVSKFSIPRSSTSQTGGNMRGKFQNPLLSSVSSSTLQHSQRNLCGDLQFPSKSEVENEVTPLRQMTIPVSFPNVNVYKHTLTAALKEHVNVMLFELSKTFHSALQRADLTGYTSSGSDRSKSLRETSQTNSNPHCQCGVSAKMVQVKKHGPNKGRFFYTCSAPKTQQCKFFQWADQVRKCVPGGPASSGIPLGDADSITTFFRGHGVMFFCECHFLRKIPTHYRKKSVTKGFPAWARQNEMAEKKLMYVRLSRKATSSMFSKDDLWIVSKNLSFEPGTTFLAKSMYFGPNSANELEIEPISGFSLSNWSNECVCHAVLAGNMSTELGCMGNIQDNVQPASLPILSHLLNRESEKIYKSKDFMVPVQRDVSNKKIQVAGHLVKEIAGDYVNKYKLNSDQAQALMKIAAMFNVDEQEADSIVLVHGVFGAGKSFLLSIIIRFLVDMFEMNDHHASGEPFPWKLLISSTTNVAVDRVLMGLLDLGFEDFVRVGSLKKISKPVLPYSVHASGTDSQELRDLQEMFRSELTPSERQYVRKSIEKHRLGENKKQLSRVRVVGVTCAAASFQCLAKMSFPFVVLDESSQMTEPSSLLPIARFGCEKLVLVGDPKQLDPTIQGSDAGHQDGLEQTLFDRLMKMGYSPVILRTQYRCHPSISTISNHLFYNGLLRDGVSQQSRHPLSDTFPTLCFYDVANGKECDDGSGSCHNEAEARLVVLVIETLLAQGLEPASIGVITLYKAQVYKVTALLQSNRASNHKELKVIQVSTVDAFQGGERDVIILSCVRTNSLRFIDCDKRMNVALTRARHHLLIVGNLKNLSRNSLWAKVLQHCEEQPSGIQKGDRVEKQLRSIITGLESTQESGSVDNSHRRQEIMRKNVKRKRNNENESPPMSLSDDDFENPTASLQSDDCHEMPVVSLTNTDNSAEESKNEAVVPNISKPVRKRLKLGNLLKPIVDTSDTDDDLPQFLDD